MATTIVLLARMLRRVERRGSVNGRPVTACAGEVVS